MKISHLSRPPSYHHIVERANWNSMQILKNLLELLPRTRYSRIEISKHLKSPETHLASQIIHGYFDLQKIVRLR